MAFVHGTTMLCYKEWFIECMDYVYSSKAVYKKEKFVQKGYKNEYFFFIYNNLSKNWQECCCDNFTSAITCRSTLEKI